jgi:peptidoglycan biosynthesis protein MviN/MurJ (putative lipid II flippase)
MTFPQGLRALNHADFRAFFAGQCVFSVFVPLLAREVLHQGAEGFGFLSAGSFGLVGLAAVMVWWKVQAQAGAIAAG